MRNAFGRSVFFSRKPLKEVITTADNIIRRDIIQLEFKSDLTALKKLNGEVDDIKKKFKDGLGDNALEDLKENAKETVKPLENVKKAAKEIVDKVTEIGKKAATSAVNGLKKVVGVSFNGLKTAISKTATKLTELGKKAAVTAFNGLKKVAGISFKALAVGIGAAATAVGALVTKSVQAYADYEQFVGGVDTLFKDSSGTVQKFANDAYKTAGLSANDYMNTVTSFSASLISSLGGDTAKAAEVANRAIIDMSDNSAKMGTDMESIMQTYQSLARGNYAMLDNLKLGETW